MFIFLLLVFSTNILHMYIMIILHDRYDWQVMNAKKKKINLKIKIRALIKKKHNILLLSDMIKKIKTNRTLNE